MPAFCAFDLEARGCGPSLGQGGMLGDPRACSCPAKLVMLHGAALLTQFFPSSWGWDWGWKGVVGGRKLSETHKSGAQKGHPALLGNPRRRGWHLWGCREDDTVADRAPVFGVRRPGCFMIHRETLLSGPRCFYLEARGGRDTRLGDFPVAVLCWL